MNERDSGTHAGYTSVGSLSVWCVEDGRWEGGE